MPVVSLPRDKAVYSEAFQDTVAPLLNVSKPGTVAVESDSDTVPLPLYMAGVEAMADPRKHSAEMYMLFVVYRLT